MAFPDGRGRTPRQGWNAGGRCPERLFLFHRFSCSSRAVSLVCPGAACKNRNTGYSGGAGRTGTGFRFRDWVCPFFRIVPVAFMKTSLCSSRGGLLVLKVLMFCSACFLCRMLHSFRVPDVFRLPFPCSVFPGCAAGNGWRMLRHSPHDGMDRNMLRSCEACFMSRAGNFSAFEFLFSACLNEGMGKLP